MQGGRKMNEGRGGGGQEGRNTGRRLKVKEGVKNKWKTQE